MWDFVKNAVVATIEEVPEQYRGLYSENAEKKFEISPAAKTIVSEYVGVSKTLATTKTQLKTANDESAGRRVTGKAVLDYVKSLGVEVPEGKEDTALELLQGHVNTVIEASKKGGEIKVNMDRVKSEAESRIKTITDAKDGEIKTMLGSLHKYLIGQSVTTALASAKGNVEVLQPHIERYTRVFKDGDNYEVRVVDPANNEIRTNGSGQPMSVSELVAEMKGNKVFAANFESETPAGTGAKPGNDAAGRTAAKPGEKSSVQLISEGLKAAQRK